MSYDKDLVKENLELEDVYSLLDYFGAEPEIINDTIVCKTICHGGDSRKLYYYENTMLFKCYTSSCGYFDIFELVNKIKELDDLNKAVYFVVNFFNLQGKINEIDDDFSNEDWKIFSQYKKINEIELSENNKLVLPECEKDLTYYPKPHIISWEKEGISKEVCDYMEICYDPVGGNILIPHKDENGRVIGIRARTLIQENEKKYGKYKPWRYSPTELYNHPLAFNLYGLDIAKRNIAQMQTAIVVESEKSVLQYLSYFGLSNNICVAVCGNSISKYQFQLLLDCGIKELVVGFDKDFTELGSPDCEEVVNRLQKIYDKYSPFVNVSFLFDKECNQLGYKDSPLDCGPEKFLYLYRHRIVL